MNKGQWNPFDNSTQNRLRATAVYGLGNVLCRMALLYRLIKCSRVDLLFMHYVHITKVLCVKSFTDSWFVCCTSVKKSANIGELCF